MNVPMPEKMEHWAGEQKDVWQRQEHMAGVGPEKVCAQQCQSDAHNQAQLGAEKSTQHSHSGIQLYRSNLCGG
jgi:hypothetical protein